MRCLAIICVLATFSFGMGGLDSLLQKTKNLEQKGVKGFVYQSQQQQVKLTSPEDLFGSKVIVELPTSIDVPDAGSGSAGGSSSHGLSGLSGIGSVSSHGNSQYVNYREFSAEMRELDKKLVVLEADREKMLAVMENLHGSSKEAIKGVSIVIKLIEVLGAIVGAVVTVASAVLVYGKTRRVKS